MYKTEEKIPSWVEVALELAGVKVKLNYPLYE